MDSKGAVPKDWFAAFHALREVIEKCILRRKVVFIDELPWLDTAKSDFLMALEAFWNEWASSRKAIHLTLVTASGLVRNQYSSRVQSEVVLSDLFA